MADPNLIQLLLAKGSTNALLVKKAEELKLMAIQRIENKKGGVGKGGVVGADEIANEIDDIFTPFLNDFDLTNHIIYNKFHDAIYNWESKTDDPEQLHTCAGIQQTLLHLVETLRDKQRKIKCENACSTYEAELENEIRDTHQTAFFNYTSLKKVKLTLDPQFEPLTQSPIYSSNQKFKLACDKLKAIKEMQKTLKTKELEVVQMQNFETTFNKHRALLNTRRDSAGMTFLKCLASIFIIPAFFIWKVKGEQVSKTFDRDIQSRKKMRNF